MPWCTWPRKKRHQAKVLPSPTYMILKGVDAAIALIERVFHISHRIPPSRWTASRLQKGSHQVFCSSAILYSYLEPPRAREHKRTALTNVPVAHVFPSTTVSLKRYVPVYPSWKSSTVSQSIQNDARRSTVNMRKVGPMAEEVVFRGCSIPLLIGAGVERTKIIWLSPLMFGFGEFHNPHSGRGSCA